MLVRIITRFPDESRQLAESLRSRGFEVQTEGKTSAQPADVDITIEECDAEEALQKASAANDASAFVIPGTITGTALPITTIPFIPQMGVQENENGGEPDAGTVSPQIQNLPHHGFGKEALHVQQAQAAPATPIGDLESRPPGPEDAPAMISEPEQTVAQHMFEGKQSQISYAMTSEPKEPTVPQSELQAQASNLEKQGETRVETVGESSGILAVEPIVNKHFQADEHEDEVREIFSAEESGQPAILPDHLEIQSHDVESKQGACGSEVLAVSADALTEPIPSAAGTPGSKVELVLEVSKDSVQVSSSGVKAPQPPVREERSSLGAQPISDWPIWQPVSKQEMAPGAAASVQESRPMHVPPLDSPRTPRFPQSELTAEFRRRRVRKSGSVRDAGRAGERVFWRTATLAGIAALVLLLAMSAHRFSPLPAALQERSADLTAPQTKPTTVAPVDLKPVSRQSRAENKGTRSSKPLNSVTAPPATAVSKVNLVSSKQPIVSPTDNSGENDTDIAEDTVVRYGNQSGLATSAPSQKKPVVKRNSDHLR
jgi:hypothetical protein